MPKKNKKKRKYTWLYGANGSKIIISQEAINESQEEFSKSATDRLLLFLYPNQ